jgi:hypothetical protein
MMVECYCCGEPIVPGQRREPSDYGPVHSDCIERPEALVDWFEQLLPANWERVGGGWPTYVYGRPDGRRLAIDDTDREIVWYHVRDEGGELWETDHPFRDAIGHILYMDAEFVPPTRL